MFYSKFERYDLSYRYCNLVRNEFAVDEYIVSAILESYIRHNKTKSIKNYLFELQNSALSSQIKKTLKFVINNPYQSTLYRRDIIKKYKAAMPFVEPCGYFGCNIHNHTI